MKTLKQILGNLGGFQPKSEDEQEFVKKHVVDKIEDVDGNGDDVFQATNVKTADRPGERHGYTDKDDDKVNEAVEKPTWLEVLKKYKVVKNAQEVNPTSEQIEQEEASLEEKTLTSAELKKREEIAQAMERENPGMDKSKKMAIATAQAKKVVEEVGQVEEKTSKPAKGKGVTHTGSYDSVPLGTTVANEEVDVSLLEMFVQLSTEEQQAFIATMDEFSEETK